MTLRINGVRQTDRTCKNTSLTTDLIHFKRPNTVVLIVFRREIIRTSLTVNSFMTKVDGVRGIRGISTIDVYF